jgi:hypothetical protein
MAAFVGEKELDTMGRMIEVAQDFVVFSLEHVTRYTAGGMTVYSVLGGSINRSTHQ